MIKFSCSDSKKEDLTKMRLVGGGWCGIGDWWMGVGWWLKGGRWWVVGGC